MFMDAFASYVHFKMQQQQPPQIRKLQLPKMSSLSAIKQFCIYSDCWKAELNYTKNNRSDAKTVIQRARRNTQL